MSKFLLSVKKAIDKLWYLYQVLPNILHINQRDSTVNQTKVFSISYDHQAHQM